MKHIIKYFCAIAVVALFTACETDLIDPLSGAYPPPENVALNKVLDKNVQKEETSRTITLALSTSGLNDVNNGTGSYIFIEFVGVRANYFLAEGIYSIEAQGRGKPGNYIAGYGNGLGTCFFDISNGSVVSKLKVTDGTIFVTVKDEHYTIKATLLLEDGSMKSITFDGDIIFDFDPPVMTYSIEVQNPHPTISGGQLNKISIFADDVLTSYIELVSAINPTSLTGNYPIADPAAAIGDAVIGFFMDFAWFGMAGTMSGGSFITEDGGKTRFYIRGGTFSVTDNSGVLTIIGNSLPLQDVSTQMAWGVLPDRYNMNVIEATRAVVYTYKVDVIVPASGGDNPMAPAPIEGSQLNTISVFADGVLTAKFEVVTAEDASSLAGTYTIKDGINAIGQMNNGFSIPLFGMEGGSFYMEFGAKMFIRENPGATPPVTLAITDNAGVLSISGNNLPILDVVNVDVFAGQFPLLPDKGSVSLNNLLPQ